MRVLVLNHNLRERGTWFRARTIARAFHQRGHDVTFICTGEGYYRPRHRPSEPRWTEWESANWTPIRERGDGCSPLGLLQRLYRIRGRFDLVYTFSHLPVDQLTARFLGPSRRGFWITDWCDLWNSEHGGLHDTSLWPRPLPPMMSGLRGRLIRETFRREDGLEQDAARRADAVSIIVSPMRDYTRAIGVADDRVLHLVSGADTTNIAPQDRDFARAELDLPTNLLVAGYIANATPDNQQLEAALEIVWREIPDLRFLSVGPRWYGDSGPAARAVASGRMIDYDRQPFARVPTFLAASDFLVMPLRDVPYNRCRWPHKLGDYMASGRPIATCDVGDMGEVVRRHQMGSVGEPSPEGLAKAIFALARDKTLRQTSGANARLAAEGEFSWSFQLDRLFAYLAARGIPV